MHSAERLALGSPEPSRFEVVSEAAIEAGLIALLHLASRAALRNGPAVRNGTEPRQFVIRSGGGVDLGVALALQVEQGGEPLPFIDTNLH